MLYRFNKYLLPLLVLILFTAGCGGGGGGGGGAGAGNVASGGIGGTGITAGVITGFGSVFVNGIEFGTGGTSFDVDGDMAANEGDLDIGMVVKIVGNVNPDGITGTADSILYRDDVEGPIAGNPVEDAGMETRTFNVLGITVVVYRNSTVFSGTAHDSLAMNDIVAVSGFFGSTGELQATRIEKTGELTLGTSMVEIRGAVSGFNGTDTFFVNGITVMFDGTTDLSGVPGGVIGDSMFVEVTGTLLTPALISARRIELESDGLGNDEDMVSIQGLVSDFAGSGSFRVNGQQVDASAAEFEPASLEALLDNNASVEVSGPIVGGVLQAGEVQQRGGKIRIIAPVTTIDAGAGTVNVSVVAGQPDVAIHTDSQTEFEDEREGGVGCSLSSVEFGTGLVVEGFISGAGFILASSIKCDDIEKTELRGPLDAASGDIGGGTVTVLGVTIATDGGTDFEGFDFATALPGDLVEIVDNLPADGVADQVEAE